MLLKRLSITAILILAIVALAAAQAKPSDMAYNTGYQAGFKLGQADKKANSKQDFTQASAYRRATDGWKEGVGGDLEAYRSNYRNGFTDGYRDGVGDPNAGPATPAAAPPQPETAAPPMEREAPPATEPRMAPAPMPAATPAPISPAPMAMGPRGSVTVPDGTIVRVRLNSTISTRSSRQGDTFTGIVTEPVYLAGTPTVAIPAGSTISGAITRVQRPGRVKGKAELHMRYDKLTMPGGGDYPMSATTSGIGDDNKTGKVNESEGDINGKASHGRDAATIGGAAAGGAVIGGLAGGPVGAGVGAAIGAGVGLGGVLVTRGKEIDLPSGTVVQIKLLQSMEVTNPVRP